VDDFFVLQSDVIMSTAESDLPEHIKGTLDVYTSQYETLVYFQDSSGANATSVPADGHTTCRYCGKGSPEVRFKTDCHALAECVGNRWLLAEDECDTCNKVFGSGIEDHFGKWSLPYRVLSCIRGKKGYPSIKREHLGWRIDSSATGISVHMLEGYKIAEFNEETQSFKFTQLPRDPFVPQSVFKALVRMAIALMPRDELSNFAPVIDWLLEKENPNVENYIPHVLHTVIPIRIPIDSVSAVLARRHTNELSVPYMIFVLMFSNYVFQIMLPCPKSLQSEEVRATLFPLLYGVDPLKPLKPKVLDLSGTQIVKDELVAYGFRFESMSHKHTSRYENIATRAYFIWQAGGSRHGNDISDWLQAEKQIVSGKSK
jgi:hypothetical protein